MPRIGPAPPPHITIPIKSVAKIREKFIPPVRKKESAIVSCFIRCFPDITSICNCPFLTFIPCYRTIVAKIDPISLTAVIICITLTALFAVGVFFTSIAALQITFFALQCFTGTISIFSTGGYIKRYYLLRRIQDEINVFEKYSEALEKHISGLEGKLTKLDNSLAKLNTTTETLKNENMAYSTLNNHLRSSLTDMRDTAAAFNTENKTLHSEVKKFKQQIAALTGTAAELQQRIKEHRAENVKLARSNKDLENTHKVLRRTVTKAGDQYKKLEVEFEKFKKANVVLADCIALAEDQQTRLKDIVAEGANITLANQRTRTLLDTYQRELSQIQAVLANQKRELAEVTAELRVASRRIQALTGQIL